jgi:hypothetical protein
VSPSEVWRIPQSVLTERKRVKRWLIMSVNLK